ncbi:MAG: helix-hairpin-helix domain-containing protein [Solirubrobacterales bacterium]
MFGLSRIQLAIYGALGLAVLVIGGRSLGGPAGTVGEGAVPGDGPAGAAVAVKAAGGGRVTVHVAGAVRKPGVYRLRADARVADAVRRAGGATARGADDAVNLAARVADGQQVVVPEEASPDGSASGGPAAPGGAVASGPVSLGSATAEQLQEIEGIGPKTAEKIIAFRQERGGVGSVDDLAAVDGIGPKTLEALRDRLQP